jgi:hypothetical protein
MIERCINGTNNATNCADKTAIDEWTQSKLAFLGIFNNELSINKYHA